MWNVLVLLIFLWAKDKFPLSWTRYVFYILSYSILFYSIVFLFYSTCRWGKAAAKSSHVVKKLSRRYHGAIYENSIFIGPQYCHDQIARSHWFVWLPIATNSEARFLQTAASPGSLQSAAVWKYNKGSLNRHKTLRKSKYLGLTVSEIFIWTHRRKLQRLFSILKVCNACNKLLYVRM